MLILSIALLGSLLALAHGVKTQHINGVRAQVITELRTSMLSRGAQLCGTAAELAIGSGPAQAEFDCEPYQNVTVQLPGHAAVPVVVAERDAQKMTARVEAAPLGGALTLSSRR